MTTHARLSPSAAYGWMNCAARPRLVADLPNESSDAALEGTAAHELASMCLESGEYDAADYVGHVFDSLEKFPVTAEMAGAVNKFLGLVYGVLGAASDAEISVEKRFKLSHIHPDMGGTADAVVYLPAARELHVFDYKHGKGVVVDVEDNPQLKSYALGALAVAKATGAKPRSVITYICQPRAMGDTVKRADYSVIELAEFAAELMVAGAACDDPNAKPKAGPWCKKTFCPAMATCPAMREAVAADFKRAGELAPMPTLPGVPLQSAVGETLAFAREALSRVKGFADAVEALAMREARAGRMPAGFKAVAGAGRRAWPSEADENPKAFAACLAHSVGAYSDSYEDFIDHAISVTSPAKLEKALPADVFSKIAPLIDVKRGEPKLVPESAKGEAVSIDVTAGFTAVTK